MDDAIRDKLNQLKLALVDTGLWSASPPPATAFDSELPFCLDAMRLEQWLQFLFLPRMQALLDAGSEIPTEVAISPLAEEVYKDNLARYQPLLEALKALEAQLANCR